MRLTEQQRRRWVSLICDAADDAGLPADPEFRSAFVAYIEWGTRLAVANSQPGAEPPPKAPVPRWGWGEAPAVPAGLGAADATGPGCGAPRSRPSGAAASCQRVPARPWPLVSKRRPATTMNTWPLLA